MQLREAKRRGVPPPPKHRAAAARGPSGGAMPPHQGPYAGLAAAAAGLAGLAAAAPSQAGARAGGDMAKGGAAGGKPGPARGVSPTSRLPPPASRLVLLSLPLACGFASPGGRCAAPQAVAGLARPPAPRRRATRNDIPSHPSTARRAGVP